jgi:hypothetical protein
MNNTHQIPIADWEDRMAQISLRKQDMNQLVMDFLVQEGYKEGALQFQKEAGITGKYTFHANKHCAADIDFGLIDSRNEVRVLIEAGKVEEATRKINEINPELLEKNSHLYFKLKKQQLIELIKAKKTEEAIMFAQQKVAPKCKNSKKD